MRSELDSNRARYIDEIKLMKELVSEITGLSARIQSEEIRNKELAQRQFGKLRKDVKSARHNERMAANYYKSMSQIDTEPQFLDKKK